MKVDFDHPFVDCFGNEIAVQKGGKSIAEQLCLLLFNLSTLGNTPLSGEEKYAAYKLCNRISANPKAVELSTEEASLIKSVAAQVFNAGPYGQIVDLIEHNQ